MNGRMITIHDRRSPSRLLHVAAGEFGNPDTYSEKSELKGLN